MYERSRCCPARDEIQAREVLVWPSRGRLLHLKTDGRLFDPAPDHSV